MASLAEKQAALLGERDAALRSLGLAELAGRVSGASDAVKDAMRRGASKKRAKTAAVDDAPAAMRRSTRATVVGGPPAAGSPASSPQEPAPPPRDVRPHGNVPWFAILDEDSTATPVAAALLDGIREATAEWLGAPKPPPLGVGTFEASPSPTAAAAEAPLATTVAHAGASAGAAAPASAAAAAGVTTEATPPAAEFLDAGIAAPALLLAHRDAGVWPLAAAAGAAGRVSPTRARAGAGAASPARAAAAGDVAPCEPRDPARLCALRLNDARGVMLVAPKNRIYSVAVHPAPGRLLALAGDSHGFLGLWAPDAGASGADGAPAALPPAAGSGAAKRARRDAGGGGRGGDGAAPGGGDAGDDGADRDDDDDGGAGGDAADPGATCTAVFRPHASPINYVQVPVGAPHLVVTASFDGSLRALDVNAGASWELSTAAQRFQPIRDGLKLPKMTGFSAFDVAAFEPSAGAGAPALVLIAGGYTGAMFIVDTREPAGGPPAAQWAAHTGKVTAVSALRGGHTVLTSTTGEDVVALWDVRRLPGCGGGTPPRGGPPPRSPFLTLPHPKGVINAFFAPHGARVVSTCNDDTVRVWDVSRGGAGAGGAPETVASPRAPAASFYHNNRTGQWLSQFRPVFDPANDGTLVLGDLEHGVGVHSAATGALLGRLTSPFLTASPTLCALHPSPRVDAVFGATASGRMYLWR